MAKSAVKTAGDLKKQPSSDPGPKCQAIVCAAAKVFLNLGFGAASMDSIAEEAKVSKQTVYSHFGSKEALFEAILENKCDELLAPVTRPLVPGPDYAETLNEVARRFLGAVLAPPSTALFRVIVGESGRFPELAQAFYRAGPETAVKSLAEYLLELDKAGLLSIPDPKASAQRFFSLLRGDFYMRRLLDLAPQPTPKENEAVAADAVSAFLSIYGSK
ncbi:MAG: TetR/AcrR family transcriptional regulator [Rhodospirillales bacterium]|nr:TetR/AcrR family transcriptional regulator [Rhodospirillales bacterium]